MDYFIQKYSITICVSDKSSRDMVRIRGFTPNPYVIHNGTVGSPFDKRIINNFNSDCFNVLVASRLSRNKGIIILITAIAEVIKLKPDICVNLHIFGMGDESYLIEINDKVRNLGLCDHVVLHGFVKNPIKYMHPFDLLVHPSLEMESLPMSVIEALSVSIPVIGTDVGGTSEILTPDSGGILIEPNNVDDIVSAIIKIMKEDEISNKYRRTLLQNRFKNYFNSETMARKYMDLMSASISRNLST